MGIFFRIQAFLSAVFLLPEEPYTPIFRDLSEIYRRELPDFPLKTAFVGFFYSGGFAQDFRAFKFDHDRLKEDRFIKGVHRLVEITVPFLPKNTMVTCPPSKKSIFLFRNPHPAERFAREFATASKFPFLSLLQWKGKKKRQSQLHREARFQNVIEKFEIARKFSKNPPKGSIVFFDDLISSGATAMECSRVLKASGYEIIHGIFLASPTHDKIAIDL